MLFCHINMNEIARWSSERLVEMACVIHSSTRFGRIIPREASQERNVLMPDGCLGLDDPMLAESLHPPEAFDFPQLRKLPEGFREGKALSCLDLLIAKSCAGLNGKFRSTPEAVRAWAPSPHACPRPAAFPPGLRHATLIQEPCRSARRRG